MPAWLKRKNSGSSRRSISHVKRRILELPSISLLRSTSVRQNPLLVISTLRRMGCDVLTAIRHRDQSSSTSYISEGDLEYTTTGHHSGPHSIAPPAAAAVSADNSRSTTCPGNGLDGQASPKVENPIDRNITEPVKSSSTPEILVPHHWPQRLRHSISSPILLSTNHSRLKEEFHNAPATVVHRPSLASRPTVLPGENELYSIVPSPPFGFRDTESASPAAQLHSSTPPSQVSTAPTSILSSNSGQNALLASIPEFNHHILEIPDAQGQHTDFQTASILTAEIAAAAKVYLEIHFNSLLSPAGDARSQRCQALQAQLQRSLMSSKDRTEARQKWLQAETEHLRRTRVLKRTKDKRPDSLSIGHYDVVRVLGKGSFGVVRLVRNKLKADAVVSKTQSSNDLTSSANGAAGLNLAQLRNKVFAMKVIRKSAMLWNSQEGHLRAERDFLVASENSRWVVPLIESFQDFNHLYLVMEYMVGGDFLGLLLRWDVLPEAVARFYVAEMISCVEEAHKMKWIHRDVKPDNFLISSSGHLKISDFGLAFDGHWSHNQSYYNETRRSILEKLGIVINGDAKDIEERQEQENLQNLATATGNGESNYHWKPSDRPEGDFVLDKLNATWRRKLAKSVVGTSQYMAPEVIQGGYYDGRCDWWSIGIILYECLYGGTPFYCNNRDETKARIVHHRRPLSFPKGIRFQRSLNGESEPLLPVSEEGKNLINSLLSSKDKRLCSKKYRENDQRGRRGSYRKPVGNTSGATFVFENDAEDIKRHPFFRNTDWDRLHLLPPPFVPRVAQDQPITKYFDDEKYILGTSDETGSTCTDDHNYTTDGPIEVSALMASLQNNPNSPLDAKKHEKALLWLMENNPHALKRLHKLKPKKRARDKILRDPHTSKTAMRVRKHGAFLGYTYRRADFPVICGDGRASARGSILPESSFTQSTPVAA